MFKNEKRSAKSLIQQIKLFGEPPAKAACFELLQKSGAVYFALFGGAVRDADYAAYHKQYLHSKDYDFRIWLPSSNFEEHENVFLKALATFAKTEIEKVPSPGTGKIRYCLKYNDVELDLSIRAVPAEMQNIRIPSAAVARDRAMDSDIGLCSIAIDSLGRVWARPEYLFDRDHKFLSVYPSDNLERLEAYTERMQKKFPNHTVRIIEKAPLLLNELPENKWIENAELDFVGKVSPQ